MNQNNLDNLKKEMKMLGFDNKLVPAMENAIKKDPAEFTLNTRQSATQGQVEMTLHFRRSSKSDFYYLNKFDASHQKGIELGKDQRYLVITPDGKGKNAVKTLDDLNQAIEHFKAQKGNAELAIGKDAASKVTKATIENGKITEVAKDFERSFYAKPTAQTFFVEKGKGFTAEQAGNLVQGRAVYRDDLMSLAGNAYKAWIKLDLDGPKDRFHNHKTNQYHDPSYGFDLGKVLEKFQIREMDDPERRTKLETALKNGNQPMITVEKDGQNIKLFIEASPRYSQVNMYNEHGRIEKREQFLKESPNIQKSPVQEDKQKRTTQRL